MVVSGVFTARVVRPRTWIEFMEGLNLFMMYVTALGLTSAIILADFFEHVIFDTMRMKDRTWQYAHELMLVLFLYPWICYERSVTCPPLGCESCEPIHQHPHTHPWCVGAVGYQILDIRICRGILYAILVEYSPIATRNSRMANCTTTFRHLNTINPTHSLRVYAI